MSKPSGVDNASAGWDSNLSSDGEVEDHHAFEIRDDDQFHVLVLGVWGA